MNMEVEGVRVGRFYYDNTEVTWATTRTILDGLDTECVLLLRPILTRDENVIEVVCISPKFKPHPAYHMLTEVDLLRISGTERYTGVPEYKLSDFSI